MPRFTSYLFTVSLLALLSGCGSNQNGDDKGKKKSTDGNAGSNAESLRQSEWGNFAAPDVLGRDTKGVAIKLSEYRGKVVMLDFWATWCGPCVALIPHEKALVKRLEGKPFTLIGLSGDRERSELTSFESNEQLPWRNIHPTPPEIAERFEIQYLPTIVLIDHEGTVRYRFVGGGEETARKLDAAIDALLAKIPK